MNLGLDHRQDISLRLSSVTLFIAVVVVALSGTAVQAVGLRDPAFGILGRIVTPGFTSPAVSVVLQADGKIIVGGTSSPNMALARYLGNGSLDSTYGTGGVAIIGIPGTEIAGAMLALDPTSGKIIAAGFELSTESFVVARFDGNGNPDTTFSGDGIAVITIPGAFTRPTGVAVQADGKVVVNASREALITSFPIIVRLNANGALDTGFGSGGVVTVPTPTFSGDMLVQSDSKLLSSGEVFIRRYNSNGSTDQDFGVGGSVPNGRGPVTLLPDGTFFGIELSANVFHLRRYKTDGSVDSSFNSTVSLSGGVAVAVRANGEPVVLSGGRIYRFSPSGALIATARAPFARDLALQADGRVITSGSFPFDNTNFAVTRYFEIYPDAKTADFDRDARADFSVFRPGNGAWYVLNSSNGGMNATPFGFGTDRIAPGDFDGDGRADIAVFRAGTWHFLASFNSAVRSVVWGQSGDIPVAADYDGDGETDVAVYRAGQWYARRSLDNTLMAASWGLGTDIPVPSNYDGFGGANFAVFRPSTGTWYVLGDFGEGSARAFGQAGDLPVPADYTGNGKTDFAVYRPGNGTWYYQDSGDLSGNFQVQQFGISTDRPVPGDYDGDTRADIAVYRDGTWYLLPSTGGFVSAQWGTAGDIPVPAGYLPQ